MNYDDERLSDLLAELHKQADNAVGYESDPINADQINALERYLGQPYGDEVTGRSAVVTREVFETIEWLRPDMARMFASGGRAVEIEPWEQGSEEEAENATDFLNHSFFERQDGARIIDSFFFDGAVQKLGVVGVYWQDATLDDPQDYDGLDEMQARDLASDDSVDVLDVQMSGDQIAMTIQRVREQAKPYVEVIAPEDFRVAPRTTDLDEARYSGRVVRTTISELKLLFPDKTKEIEEYGDASRETLEMDERRAARFWDEETLEATGRDEDDDVILMEEYLYYDLDGDGYAELIEVKRLEDCILSAQPVEEHPFAAWTPISIPHKLYGLSIADVSQDIQRSKTVLLRAALDATYQAVAPRVVAIESQVNLADLLTVRPGQVIRAKEGARSASDVVHPLVTPNLAPAALQMMEWIDQAAEARTGVTRHAQGLDPDSLNKTATGIRLMQNAASARKEMIARNLASGLEKMFRKYFRLLVRNQQRPQNVRIGKQWKTYTPSTWDAEARVRVHVGHGTGDRETQVGQLMMLLQLQEKVVALLGVANPVVTPKHMHRTMEHITRVMGFRNEDQFFADPAQLSQEQSQQMMQPPTNPELEKAKMQMQVKQIELQADQQSARQQAAIDQQNMDREFALKREQLDRELALKREQMIAELELERQLKMTEIGVGVRTNGSSISSDPVRIGGAPG